MPASRAAIDLLDLRSEQTTAATAALQSALITACGETRIIRLPRLTQSAHLSTYHLRLHGRGP